MATVDFMELVTVQQLIETLKKFPKNAPVFGYSVDDECDFPIQAVECTSDPNYCQGYSYAEEYLNGNGVSKVVYLKMSEA